MNHHLDTIAAQATAAGEGGIAIVRVSGSRCEEILSQVFRAKNGKPAWIWGNSFRLQCLARLSLPRPLAQMP